MPELFDAIEKIGTSFERFKKVHDERFENLQKQLDDLREERERKESLHDRPRASFDTPHRNRREHKMFEEFARTGSTETKEMSIAGGAEAGQAMVPEFIADEIISQALGMSDIARYVRRTRTATSDYVRLVNKRGATAAWSSETGSRTATSAPLLREVRPTHGELYALVTVSNWLLNDAKFDVASFIMENATDQFAKALDAAIYDGDGSNKPTGIFNTTPVSTDDFASPERPASAIQYISGTGDVANDVIALYFALKSEYRRNARFAMSSGVLASVRKARDSNGSGFLWQQNLSQGLDAPEGLLLGRPVFTWEEMPATLTSSPETPNKILCGDFARGYELVEIGPMTIIRDPYSVKGKTSFYIAQRFGGKIVDNNALKVLSA